MHIRKGDTLQVISGDERPRLEEDRERASGTVIEIDTRHNRVKIQGKNLITKHVRKTQGNPQGSRLEKEGWIHASNVAVFCPACKRGRRTKTVRAADRSKRVCAQAGCGREL
jgi:large subunit ribosomal protein L24